MNETTYSVNKMRGMSVIEQGDRQKRIGKVRSFVFHPSKRLVVGFTVKRPDVAWMFHRSDLFVAFDAFECHEGKLYVSDDQATTGKAACKRLGISWDDCILWQGLPLMTDDGVVVGHVGDVTFDATTGQVVSLSVDQGATRNALLGTSHLDASQILGFKLGVGDNLDLSDEGEFVQGVLIVADDAVNVERLGGLAEKAGAASAVASYKVSEAVDAAKPKVSEAADAAKTAVGVAKDRAETAWKNRPDKDEATERASVAMEEGAYKLGKQMSRARGMFSGFKENYRQALEEETNDKQ